MKRDARLWIVTRKYPPAVGGMEQLSYHVAGQLARRRPITLVRWGRSQAWLPFFATCAALRLLAGLLRNRVSMLLVGDPLLAALGLLARRFGVPVLVVVHGLDVAWRNPLYQAYLDAFFWHRFDAYISISRHTASLVRAHGVPEHRVFVVPVGIEVREPVRPAEIDGEPLLLFIGRLVKRKGAAWFTRDVLPGLCARFPALRFVIAGAGPERSAIEAAAREAGLSDRLVILGAVSDETKWALLARCDAVVVPNIPVSGDVEGFGIVALEAGAAARPAFVADLEGLRDAVTDGVSGWRLPTQDAAAWVAALTSRLADRPSLRAQGEVARDHVARQFHWDSIGERYAAIVERFSPQH